MMTVALTPNHHIGSIVSSAFYAIWNLFSGFVVPQTVTTNILHTYIHIQTMLICILHIHTQNETIRIKLYFYDREFQYGGDGTIGLALLLGPCMDCLLHNMEMSRTFLSLVKL